jgi:hypothetical protein
MFSPNFENAIFRQFDRRGAADVVAELLAAARFGADAVDLPAFAELASGTALADAVPFCGS